MAAHLERVLTANHRPYFVARALLVRGMPLQSHNGGVNRGTTFVDAEDHSLHLTQLAEVITFHDVDVRAYALMSNPVLDFPRLLLLRKQIWPL